MLDTQQVLAGGGALRGAPGQELLLSASCPVVDRDDGHLTGCFASRKVSRTAATGNLTAYGVMLDAGGRRTPFSERL